MSDNITSITFDQITEHLLKDDKPSEYMNELSLTKVFKNYPLEMLLKLKSTEQSPKYHPEGSAWNHTMLVVDEAAKVRSRSKEAKIFMWSALLHDIGKPVTTRIRKGKVTSYDHDSEGERLSREFLNYFSQEERLIEAVSAMVRYHMHMLYVLKKLPYSDVKGLLRRVDIEEIALLCLCDRLGRTGADVGAEEEEYQDFIEKLKYSASKINQTNH